jgi:predicted DNA-binding protein with PD1-like motif
MSDREQELRGLADDLSRRDSVVDAWTAKSFTDRLFVVELEPGTDLSEEVVELLSEHGLRGYNEVHDVGVEDAAFAGDLEGSDRYQFVDVRQRGELQSYVV